MHGDWGHIAGNMLFLYVFGDNVEDRLGHGRYVLFYLLSGICAALAQAAVDPTGMMPMVGASGAIAGALGAYVVLYPKAPIMVFNPVFLLWFVFGPVIILPAWIMVGVWFFWNLVPGIASVGLPEAGGVAFFAHIGGFLAGLIAVKPFCTGRARRGLVGVRRPASSSACGPPIHGADHAASSTAMADFKGNSFTFRCQRRYYRDNPLPSSFRRVNVGVRL
jgi:membrane associated rhomboid family serine protease